jgi:hypothetical protein
MSRNSRGESPFLCEVLLAQDFEMTHRFSKLNPACNKQHNFHYPTCKILFAHSVCCVPSQFITKEGVSVSRLGIGIIHNLEPFLYVDALVMEREIVRDSDERFSFP